MSLEVKQALKLTNKMTILSDQFDQKRDEPELHVLAGIIRDAAYKIRKAAEEEKQRLKIYGKWEGDE